MIVILSLNGTINNFRAVRAMNETLKQNRLLRGQEDDRSFSHPSNERNSSSDVRRNVGFICPGNGGLTLCSSSYCFLASR